MTETPWIVANQSPPSRLRHAEGWKEPLHSADLIPSASPYETDVTRGRLPAKNSSSSARPTRKIPRLQLIQKFPCRSSTIEKTTSSNRPFRAVTAEIRLALKRSSPSPVVPIQSVPSGSVSSESTELSEVPCPGSLGMASNFPPRRHESPVRVAIQSEPSGPSRSATTSFPASPC